MQQYKNTTSDQLGRYYTKNEISLVLRDAMSCEQVSSILDLGSGEGALSLPFLERFPDARCVTVDIDIETKFPVNYQSHIHYKKDVSDPEFFLKNHIKERGFDIVLCNPPFIDVDLNEGLLEFLKLNDYKINKVNRKRISAEVIFVIHAINALVDGGTLGLIVPDGFISGEKYKHFREYLIYRGEISKVIKLPRTAFEKTDVQAHILVFVKKNSSRKIKVSKIFNGSLEKIIDVATDLGSRSLDYDIILSNKVCENIKYLTLDEMGCLISRGKLNSKQCKLSSIDVFHTTSFDNEYRVNFERNVLGYSFKNGMEIAECGDILIARVGKCISAKIAIVEGGSTVISDCILKIRVPEKYRQIVFDYITSSEGRKKIESRIIGASAKYITKSSLLQLSIPIE